MMYTARIIAEGQRCKGKPIPVGTIVSGSEAWIHCLPGMRNSPPVAEPVDDLTAEKVKAELARRKALHAVNVPIVQAAVDTLAAKLPTDDAGQFVRRPDGTIPRATDVEQFQIDNAEAYGIVPGAGVTMVETVANTEAVNTSAPVDEVPEAGAAAEPPEVETVVAVTVPEVETLEELTPQNDELSPETESLELTL